jgi:muconolactone delta-isomerase
MTAPAAKNAELVPHAGPPVGVFMVVAGFSTQTDLPAMNAVVAEEVARVDALTAEGRLGAVHVSPVRGRVFLEVHASTEAEARATVETLPMAKWWDIDVYPTMGPPDGGALGKP